MGHTWAANAKLAFPSLLPPSPHAKLHYRRRARRFRPQLGMMPDSSTARYDATRVDCSSTPNEQSWKVFPCFCVHRRNGCKFGLLQRELFSSLLAELRQFQGWAKQHGPYLLRSPMSESITHAVRTTGVKLVRAHGARAKKTPHGFDWTPTGLIAGYNNLDPSAEKETIAASMHPLILYRQTVKLFDGFTSYAQYNYEQNSSLAIRVSFFAVISALLARFSGLNTFPTTLSTTYVLASSSLPLKGPSALYCSFPSTTCEPLRDGITRRLIRWYRILFVSTLLYQKSNYRAGNRPAGGYWTLTSHVSLGSYKGVQAH
jgi:hypothetical protein